MTHDFFYFYYFLFPFMSVSVPIGATICSQRWHKNSCDTKYENYVCLLYIPLCLQSLNGISPLITDLSRYNYTTLHRPYFWTNYWNKKTNEMWDIFIDPNLSSNIRYLFQTIFKWKTFTAVQLQPNIEELCPAMVTYSPSNRSQKHKTKRLFLSLVFRKFIQKQNTGLSWEPQHFQFSLF